MKRYAAVAALLFPIAVLAADHPNFSGTWKENMEKSTKSRMTSYVNKIEQSGDSLKVTTTSTSPRGDRTFDRTYAIGKEESGKAPDGDPMTTLAKWDGNALTITSTMHEPDGSTMETKESWTLSADGKTLTKQRHSHGSRGDRDETHVLEKQ